MTWKDFDYERKYYNSKHFKLKTFKKCNIISRYNVVLFALAAQCVSEVDFLKALCVFVQDWNSPCQSWSFMSTPLTSSLSAGVRQTAIHSSTPSSPQVQSMSHHHSELSRSSHICFNDTLTNDLTNAIQSFFTLASKLVTHCNYVTGHTLVSLCFSVEKERKIAVVQPEKQWV